MRPLDGKRFRDIRDPMRKIGAVLEARPPARRTARNRLRMLAAANRMPTSRVDEVFDIVGSPRWRKSRGASRWAWRSASASRRPARRSEDADS